MTTIGHFINGETCLEAHRTQPVFNPSTGTSENEVAIASKQTVEQAIAAAEAAFGEEAVAEGADEAVGPDQPIAVGSVDPRGRRSTRHLIERAVERLIRAGGRKTEADAAHLLAASQEQVIAEMQAGRELGECRRADDARTRLRELAFRHLREVLIKICAGGKLQHSISQEFETFVMGRVPLRLIGIRGMRQGLVEKSDIVERHAEAL